MLLLTDCPERLDNWPEADRKWEELSAGSVSESKGLLPDLLQIFNPVFHLEVRRENAPGNWDCFVVVRHSPASQFDLLVEAAREGAPLPERVACLALEGENFRGNRKRSWQAQPGNIHLTTYHRLDGDARRLGAGMSMVPSVSVVDAIREIGPELPGVGIKWVNDVLIDGAKVSGVLTETQVQGDRVQSVVWGIGLNVEKAPAIEPTPFLPKAGCLADFFDSSQIDFNQVCRALLQAVSNRFESLVQSGSGEIYRDYRRWACGIEREVCVWPEATVDFSSTPPLARGTLLDINPDLSLKLEGINEPITRGRLVFGRGIEKQ